MKRLTILAALGAASPLLLAACGGASGHAASAAPTGAATVTTRTVMGIGTVAVDASGHALYTDVQEGAGHILCTTDCTKVWLPLTVSGGAQPSGSGGADHLGVMTRPDGTRQVTYAGKPLYRFSFDKSAGQVTGNGASDSFGAEHFTWHVVTFGSAATSPSHAPPSGSGGYGGYYG